jgi:WD40 repeat-containing protein SMU1
MAEHAVDAAVAPPAGKNQLSVDAVDVIQAMEQFMVENKLFGSLNKIIEETGVRLSGTSEATIEKLTGYINEGEWVLAVAELAYYQLSSSLAYELYGQIAWEMADSGFTDQAIEFLKGSKDLDVLRKDNPKKYRRMIAFVYNFDEAHAYKLDRPGLYLVNGRSLKLSRRAELADKLKKQLAVVPSSRMMSMFASALKHQQYLGLLPKDGGSRFNIFTGRKVVQKITAVELPPKRKVGKIKLGKCEHLVSLFSPSGKYFVCGGTDGLIEIFDPITFKHTTDLAYQNEQKFMLQAHSPVQSMAMSRDEALLATGGKDGTLTLWDATRGVVEKSLAGAHAGAITSVAVSGAGQTILTASLDHAVRLWGRKSGNMLNEFLGHSSFVNSAAFGETDNTIISGGSDGKICVWDAQTRHSRSIGNGLTPDTVRQVAVLKVVPLKKRRSENSVLVCNRTSTMNLLGLDGNVRQRYGVKANEGGSDAATFSNMFVSHLETMVHGVMNGFVYSFHIQSGNMVSVLNVKDGANVLGFTRHPQRNLYASYGKSGKCYFFESIDDEVV